MIGSPGISCPECGGATEVKDSRPTFEGNSIRRRRRCVSCGLRCTTFEEVRVESEPTGQRDPFKYRRADEMRRLFADLSADDAMTMLRLVRRLAGEPAAGGVDADFLAHAEPQGEAA